MNKHNQKPTDMFNKQDVTVYLTYIKSIKRLKYTKFSTSQSRNHFQSMYLNKRKPSENPFNISKNQEFELIASSHFKNFISSKTA